MDLQSLPRHLLNTVMLLHIIYYIWSELWLNMIQLWSSLVSLFLFHSIFRFYTSRVWNNMIICLKQQDYYCYISVLTVCIWKNSEEVQTEVSKLYSFKSLKSNIELCQSIPPQLQSRTTEIGCSWINKIKKLKLCYQKGTKAEIMVF